ncbi:UDP-3-O-(3-hydroxymyristoyl)glucosamine N-acyltransferase [Telmatospirillum sp.]|uniref:UDP-3-O-(3-hydroxymyristoyl)glucosamine N-acyltransferase n=1 Tax=Telmatospirillum sp. TaxID=2079197 RepID=UPI00284466D6|nr:UDP-3-O-(3-hydroxymyristoyl)glucosamine N-acyltransferase [Telmatospirillum sp.]MDR3441333.1 UDP-3-O-(3-hydroxymyristoyl)glucosamine N-acyltransferase [Telmatospirillum sp.]
MNIRVSNNLVGDSRFYDCRGPFTLSQIATAVRGKAALSDRQMFGVAPLHTANESDVSFINSRRYLPALLKTGAGAVIVSPALEHDVPLSASLIVCADPDEAWAIASALFHPKRLDTPGIHASANVALDATVHATAEVGAFACIESGAEVGPNCCVESYAHIGHGVSLGADCRVGTHASVSYALLGQRVRIFPGVRIGQDGFGFSVTPAGFVSAPQLGRVIIEDDVEIGANTTIDRGSVGDTIIGAGSRIDNLVQIGHNVRLGRCCVIVAQVGIAGSTVLEDFVRVGGQAALAGHLRVGIGVQIGAQAGLISNAPAHSVLLGSPAQSRHEFFRQVAVLKRLARRSRQSREIGWG